MKISYQVKVGTSEWKWIRALAEELEIPDIEALSKEEIIRLIATTPFHPGKGGYNIVSIKCKAVGRDFLISVEAEIVDEQALLQEAIDSYFAAWPLTHKEPDPWSPIDAEDALFAILSLHVPATLADHSDYYWLEEPKFKREEKT